MSMEILEAGALTTVQDAGRRGYASHGFQENGACDRYNYQVANLLAGNFGQAVAEGVVVLPAVLEMTLRGAEIRFTSHEIIALAGADMKPQVNGIPVSMYCPLIMRPGDILKMGIATAGLRTYLAVYGGIDVPMVMGSRSTSLKCRLGGFEGRMLKKGDVLNSLSSPETTNELRERIEGMEADWSKTSERYPLPAGRTRTDGADQFPVLRAVAGPQEEAFTENGLQIFETAVFRLSTQCDRMACKLNGAAIETMHGSDIISDGIVAGSVQVASDGTPIVLMADHQTAGGYAKIATVIRADMPRLAQRRPGEKTAFQFVSPQEAVEAARKMAEQLAHMEAELRTLC